MKKEWIIAGSILLACLLVAGGIFLFTRSSATTKNPNIVAPQASVPTLTPDQLGLTLVPRQDNQALILTVTKISDVSTIEYELDYTATGDIPRGVIGKLTIQPTQTSATQTLVLGTCSDVCHYDTGVSNIKLTLKVTKTDGTVYSLDTTASINQ